ncbi:MAG: DUF488 family protein [Planctomycetota bacterium]|nr:DUF488 family protein [Planctomycetota bacterium]
MSLKLSTYRYGTARRRGEGLRIGTTRFLPRGVARQDYATLNYFDVWLPVLAPSRELLRWYRDGEPSVEDFYRRYRKQMRETDAKQAIALLREIASRTPIAVGCFCENESRCHRRALEQLIRETAKT